MRRLSELKEALSRESSLRKSLEDSHQAMLLRIRDMECVVEEEREQVRNDRKKCLPSCSSSSSSIFFCSYFGCGDDGYLIFLRITCAVVSGCKSGLRDWMPKICNC